MHIPYPLYKNPLRLSVACVRLIGQICQVSVEPIIPEKHTHEGRILRESTRYLRELASEGRLSLSVQTHEETDGRVYAGLLVNIGGEQHTAASIMPSKKRALRDAGAQLIKRLNLIDAVPPLQPPERAKRTPVANDPKQNPIVLLHARQQTAGGSQAEYSFSDPYGDNGSEYACTVRLTDVDGQEYEATGDGVGRKIAKQRAAAALLAQLPKRPLNKKGKTY